MKKRINLTLDEEVLNRLREIAEEEVRSLSQTVNRILKRHLEKITDESQ